MQYCVLLDHLYKSGINRKCWRIVDSLYSDTTAEVKINRNLTTSFILHQGVRQGSVLYLMLFVIVIDSLVNNFRCWSVNKINGIYTGSLGHADDLQSILTCGNKQAKIVEALQWK